MIGPLRLSQVTTHIGLDPLCLCCCDDEELNIGGHQFGHIKNSPPNVISFPTPVTTPNAQPKPEDREIDNDFIRFEQVLSPLATSVSESDIVSENKEDYFDAQILWDRASVDGLPDKAQLLAPQSVPQSLGLQSDLDLQEQEFFLLLCSEVA